jgi:S-adenosylmethionine:tRNA ribosyltransferase-isomerase
VLVAEFDFDLPDELIAQEPPRVRGGSRLLVLERTGGVAAHASFADLPARLRAGDLLVVNDTRVFPARLLGRLVPSSGAVECLLLRQRDTDTWDALVNPGQKLKPGARVVFERAGHRLEGEVLAHDVRGRRTIRLVLPGGGDIGEAIDVIGHLPLPPYIKREDNAADWERYQTVFARDRGSVAAPTAGLHFTREALDALAARGVELAQITLHVGYGTFKPVTVPTVEAHTVEAERFRVTLEAAAALTRARRDGRRIIAVGTTTVRALESLAVTASGGVEAAEGETQLFIQPGHMFRLTDGLITNFHLPRSSLLMLVSAFAGRTRILSSYREAVSRRYRFYSYGDAMLIL